MRLLKLQSSNSEEGDYKCFYFSYLSFQYITLQLLVFIDGGNQFPINKWLIRLFVALCLFFPDWVYIYEYVYIVILILFAVDGNRRRLDSQKIHYKC